MSKTTQLEGIPTKLVTENLNFFATFLVKDTNTCIRKGEFHNQLKTADLILVSSTIFTPLNNDSMS